MREFNTKLIFIKVKILKKNICRFHVLIIHLNRKSFFEKKNTHTYMRHE